MNALSQLAQLALSPSGFVFDTRTGATFTVNAAGVVLLEGLREGQGLAELVETLLQQFDARGHDLARDVLEFVRRLQVEGLLPRDFELEA